MGNEVTCSQVFNVLNWKLYKYKSYQFSVKLRLTSKEESGLGASKHFILLSEIFINCSEKGQPRQCGVGLWADGIY